jgi:myb proto-oncogene protein
VVEGQALAELAECCRKLEEGQHAWAAHQRKVAWQLNCLEQRLEMESEMQQHEVWEEFECINDGQGCLLASLDPFSLP